MKYIEVTRKWMHNHRDSASGEVTKEFHNGLCNFMNQAISQPFAIENNKIFCPCPKCVNK